MKFDVYGRFRIEVIRESDRWLVYRIDQGRRLIERDLIIPDDVTPDLIPRWLEDLLHEYALPDRTIRPLK